LSREIGEPDSNSARRGENHGATRQPGHSVSREEETKKGKGGTRASWEKILGMDSVEACDPNGADQRQLILPFRLETFFHHAGNGEA